MASARRIAFIFGLLYLITFATSIPAVLLFQPPLDDPVGFVTDGGSDTRIYVGALLELILIIANIGTAIVLIPLLKRESEILTFSYVAARIMESVFILVGILALLALVTMSNADSGGEEGSIAWTLAEIKDWTFKLGPGWVVGIGNGLILGWLMLRSGLMPRWLALLGVIGGPIHTLGGTAVLFDLVEPGVGLQGLLTIPEIIWELSLGIYPLIWGFRRTRVVEEYEAERAARPATVSA